MINQYIHVHVLIHGVTFKVHAYTWVYISIHIVHRQFNKLKIYQIILRWPGVTMIKQRKFTTKGQTWLNEKIKRI